MDIGKAFGFVFEDERWITKVLIGGLLVWIPIVNFAVFGYMLKVAENVAKGSSTPLPEWSDFGDLFMRGLYYVIIYIVYSLPSIIVSCIFGVIQGGLTASADQSSDAAAGGVVLLACIGNIITLVLSIGTMFVLYPALARYVATGSLSEAFKFGEVFSSARANVSTWVMVILVAILAGLVGSLGLIACVIGVIFTLFYAQVVQGHVLGQAIVKTGLLPAYGDTPAPYVPPTSYQ
ncbi:DUF4013 domain-containing protein [Chloroflexia bacterium SDU3-3]|nr:DUF4013 domain-containing protein [Chloroflexia bacterium SDU3-3]